MNFECHRYASPSDKQIALGKLEEAMERFRDELESSQAKTLVFM
jgi:hypothetical protein